MSLLEHSPEVARSKPGATPLGLAIAAQKAIRDHAIKVQVETALIRQLLTGRYVRSKLDGKVYLVTEVRITLGWNANIHGRTKGKRSSKAIGNVFDVELEPEKT